tara:strand:+ start:83 stop:598 length:516 start_codon:yes stop_codon:yes gene_type:complete
MPLTKIIGSGSATPGSVLQVVQTVDTTPVTTTNAGAWTDLGNLSVSITPSSTSSKVMIECHIGQFDHSDSTQAFHLKYVRGSTDIGIGVEASNRLRVTTGIRGAVGSDTNGQMPILMPKFLDSPSTTSATTYKVQYYNSNSAWYYLRSSADSDSVGHARFIATITATEIAG